jgi:hypothetical protein
VKGTRVFVAEHDLLDGTPILDIKPYLPYADSFPDAKAGWVDELADPEYAVDFGPVASEQLAWLEEQGLVALRPFLLEQLAVRPTDTARKRLQQFGPNRWEIAYRTWRVDFQLGQGEIQVQSVRSGYTPADLADGTDPYSDKDLHRAFIARFGGGGSVGSQ